MADQHEINTGVAERLSSIETKLDILISQGTPQCAVHTQQIGSVTESISKLEQRLEKTEAQLGQKHLLRIVFTAIGAGLGIGVTLAARAIKG